MVSAPSTADRIVVGRTATGATVSAGGTTGAAIVGVRTADTVAGCTFATAGCAAAAGCTDVDANAGASTVFRADRPLVGVASSPDATVADGLDFLTGSLTRSAAEAWPAPEGNLSEVVFWIRAVSPSWPRSGVVGEDDTAAELEGVVLIAPLSELDGVVLTLSLGELDGVVPVVPLGELDGVVPVAPAAGPDCAEVELDVADESDVGAAHATPDDRDIAEPMPNAIANAPTRPTCNEWPIEVPSGGVLRCMPNGVGR